MNIHYKIHTLLKTLFIENKALLLCNNVQSRASIIIRENPQYTKNSYGYIRVLD